MENAISKLNPFRQYRQKTAMPKKLRNSLILVGLEGLEPSTKGL
jgi:hypothetical protein